MVVLIVVDSFVHERSGFTERTTMNIDQDGYKTIIFASMSDNLPDDIAGALQKAKYNEFVRIKVADGPNNRDIVLMACLDKENGGIQWRNIIDDESTNVDPTVQFFRTKRWVFPMLNDETRNEMYQKAIRCAVETLRDRAISRNEHQSTDRTWCVLDIGSGTGFLGMLAASAFKEILSKDNVKVLSIEMAEEMATVARRTIQDNQLADIISVIEGHSCELPPISPKADLCVSELLESGLLGEGILPALRDAWDRHLRDDALMIPQRARVFAQLVGCKKGEANWLEKFYGPHNHIIEKSFVGENRRPLRWNLDPDGSSMLLDARQVQIPVHAKKLFDMENIIGLSEAVPVFEFDFTSRNTAMVGIDGRRASTTTSVTKQGTICGVLLWWELDLWEGITYSCEPGTQPFQDHWQQCLQILPSGDCIHVEPEDTITAEYSHNDERIFIDAVRNGSRVEPESKRFRKADSDVSLISPFRAYQLNESSRLESFKWALAYSLSVHANGKAARILDISDGGWGACLAGALGATNVLSIESTSDDLAMMAARIAQQANQFPFTIGGETAKFDILLGHLENLSSEDLGGQLFDIVIADYYHILEGWHLQESLNFFYKCRSLQRRNLISDQSIILPCSFRVMACAIESDQLRSAYSSCGDDHGCILGLDHSYLNKVGANFSSYDLSLPVFWQYDYKELTEYFEIASFKSGSISSYDDIKVCSLQKFERPGSVDAVVFWIEYDFPKAGLSFSTNKEPYNQLVRMMPTSRSNFDASDLDKIMVCIQFSCGGLDSPATHELRISIENV